MMRLVRLTVLLACAGLPTTAAFGAELTADDVVDRMLAANSAWLRAEGITSLSYIIERSHNGKQPSMDATIRVWYRAPRDLRIESEPGHKVLIWLDGRRYPSYQWACNDCDAAYVRDVATAWVVFRGGMWELANHRNQCKLENLRRERVDGRNAYYIRVTGYCPPAFPLNTTPSPTDCYDWRELWIDAETFRPLREAWNDGCTPGSPYFEVVRYADWQPFPGGGEAPTVLEGHSWPEDLPFDADPPGQGWRTEYQVVAGKYWLRQGDGIKGLSLAPIPDGLFRDEQLMARLDRLGQLQNELKELRTGDRLDDLSRVVEEILALGEYDVMGAKGYAFGLRFWRGDYAGAAEFKQSATFPHGLWLAWAYDAVGKREEALKMYHALEKGTDERSAWALAIRQGLKAPWVPIARRLEPAADQRLLAPSADWRAASNTPGFDPAAAIDGDRRTRWVTAMKQSTDMWFEVDLGAPTTLRRVAFDFGGTLALRPEEYPRRYRVETSTDGTRWDALASGPGPVDNLVNVAFTSRPVRYLRMSLDEANDNKAWAINEVFFYATK
jgi:hypothetical protein